MWWRGLWGKMKEIEVIKLKFPKWNMNETLPSQTWWRGPPSPTPARTTPTSRRSSPLRGEGWPWRTSLWGWGLGFILGEDYIFFGWCKGFTSPDKNVNPTFFSTRMHRNFWNVFRQKNFWEMFLREFFFSEFTETWGHFFSSRLEPNFFRYNLDGNYFLCVSDDSKK